MGLNLHALYKTGSVVITVIGSNTGIVIELKLGMGLGLRMGLGMDRDWGYRWD